MCFKIWQAKNRLYEIITLQTAFLLNAPLLVKETSRQCPCSHQPFKQQYQNSNSTNWPPKISYGISWEKTPIKNNGFCTIIVLNLMPSFFDYALIL